MSDARKHNRDAVGMDDGLPALMRRAIRLAAPTHPHPNPRVGAVVVAADGRIVGEGAHVGAGSPHAEILALAAAGPAAIGSTVVVTLEPCAHHGRTGPCVDALISAGVASVVVGASDPDERVSGQGIARLRSAGIQVVEGVENDAARTLDPGYFHHRSSGLPLVTVKVAATLDGQSAAADGTSQWITSSAAREDAHRLRAGSDVVMVGAGTLRADDPRLDVRIDGHTGPQPRPAVVMGSAPGPDNPALAGRDPLVYTTDRIPAPAWSGETVVVAGAGGMADLGAVVDDLGRRQIVDLLVEGGPRLAGEMIRQGLADRIVVYYGAVLATGSGKAMLGGAFATLSAAVPVVIDDVRMVGPDLRVLARPATGNAA